MTPVAVQLDNDKVVRTAIWGVVAILAIVLILVLIPKIKALFGGFGNLITGATVSPSNLTYPKPQYVIFADQIFTAVDGAQTDEDAIYEVFNSMETYDDISQLIVAYGVREVSDPGGFGWWVGQKNQYNLAQSLRADLDSSELAKVNQILAQKEIKYKF